MKCQKYYAKKDENGFPIPGTMMGFRVNPGSCGFNQCQLVELLPETYELQGGEARAYHPNGLHFFVKIDSKGKIIPNSLTSSFAKPKGALTAEFIKVVPAPPVQKA
jgi:hypothetical protein